MQRTRHLDAVDHFVKQQPRAVKSVLIGLRKLIRSSVPDVTEHFQVSSHRIVYRVAEGKKSYAFCFLATATKEVHLGFDHGSALTDPENLLAGKGKRVRHVVVAKRIEIDPDTFSLLIAEAALVAVNRGQAIE